MNHMTHKNKKITKEQYAVLLLLLEEYPAIIEQIQTHHQVTTLKDLPYESFTDIFKKSLGVRDIHKAWERRNDR